MDTDSNPPNKIDKPPAHVYSDKEFDERFNRLFIAKNPTKNFYASRLGAVSSIFLPGAWVERSRNKRAGMVTATAFVQKDKVVSHCSGFLNEDLLSLLKEAPHTLSQAELDSLKGIGKKELVSASTIDIKGKPVLQMCWEGPTMGAKIAFYFAGGTLFPDSVEMLSFESPGKLATIQKDVDLAKQTWSWNSDRWVSH